MKECKVEVIVQHVSNGLVFKAEKVEKKLQEKIQAKIDEYMNLGYKLISTSSSIQGFTVYTQLYFER